MAAGLRLVKRGHSIILIEKDDHVGGLAGGVVINGNTYEYGPHAFHTTDPEILNDIKTLMGDELIAYKRTIKIKFLGNYFNFPLSIQDVLLKLPFRTVILAGLSFLWYFAAGYFWKPKVETSETLLRRYYGDVLYKIFFKTYITNVWGIPPSEFSPDFARERIPRLNFVDFLEKASKFFKKQTTHDLKTEKFVEKVEGNLYTTKQGFSLITQRIADSLIKQGGGIHLNANVVKIIREKDKISGVEFIEKEKLHCVACDGLINTLPINETMLMTEPKFDNSILEAANHLKFRALVFVGLLISRTKVLPSSFMYFRQHSFNRISDLGQFGFRIHPERSTVLIAEISCDVTDRAWMDEAFAKEEVVKDLIREGLIQSEELMSAHVFRARHAYPMYTLHYEQHLDLLLKTVENMTNMETAGRQGRFQYINTHIAIKMGYEAADKLMNKIETSGKKNFMAIHEKIHY